MEGQKDFSSVTIVDCIFIVNTLKDFLIGGVQSETTPKVVSNLYNNL